MKRKKTLLATALIGVMICGVIAGLIWHSMHYIMVDFRFYPRDAEMLDLRDQEVSTSLYDKLSLRLPNTEIRWNIPFQGDTYPDTTTAISVTSLSAEDVHTLTYFSALTLVDATGCTDYENLLTLAEELPEVEVRYTLPIDGQNISSSATDITLGNITAEELALLPGLRNLTSVTLTGGDDTEQLKALQSYCYEADISLNLRFGEITVQDTATSLKAVDTTSEELNLLALMDNLDTLELKNPQADAEEVLALEELYPKADITWSVDIWGVEVEKGATELDLSAGTPTTLEEVETGCTYFPTLEEVFLGKTDLDNDDIADYRERRRSDYKVVWTVGFRDKLYLRTDEKAFFPCHPNKQVQICNFNDTDAENLIYFEELEAMDIGHMPIHNVDFLAYMPKLKYLILSWTQVTEISAISNCKELIFLEITDACLQSLEGIQGCTALEDLNISNNWPDVTPLLEMTWLKRVYMIYGSGSDAYTVAQALPDTTVVTSGDATVGGGWRRLDNYYAMRDALDAPYMN